MRHVVLVTEDDRVIDFFQPLRRSRKFSFEVMKYREWSKSDDHAFCYLDISSLKQRQLESELRALSRANHPWGIVDPEGIVDDVAALFHRGAGDYIDLRREFSFKTARVRRAVDFFTHLRGEEFPEKSKKSEDLSPSKVVKNQRGVGSKSTDFAQPSISWEHVKKNGEYSFSFLYVELLPSGDWKGKSGDSHKEQMQTAFHDVVAERVAGFGGKIWMWNEWTGLVLFPFDGKNCDAVVPGIRLLLNRVLISIEGGAFQTVLNFKLALHVGSTTYRERGQTGTIISDDVNFIFHLGVKKAEANTLYLTDTSYPLISKGLHPLFQEGEVFEGHRIYHMASPFHR